MTNDHNRFTGATMINTQIATIASCGNPASHSEFTQPNAGGRQKFLDTDHGLERKLAREAIDKAFKTGKVSRTERDLVRTVLNLWFHHRGEGQMGVIRPGRAYLARKNKCSVRTVASLLKRLRDEGLLLTIAYAKGGRRATQYRLDVHALMVWCGVKFPEVVKGALKLLTRPLKAVARIYQNRAMSAHGNNNPCKWIQSDRPEVGPDPGNWWEDWEVAPNV